MRTPALLALCLAGLALVACGGAALAQSASPSPRFDPDNWPQALLYRDIPLRFGATPTPGRRTVFGVVMKYLGNQYWQLLAQGMSQRARDLGIVLDIQAGASEADLAGQLHQMHLMLDKGYKVILLSPQTDTNLLPAVAIARKKGVLLVNVNDAVLEDAEHFVGPNQRENGVRAAAWLRERFPAGGKVALVRGIEGVYAVNQRSAGFLDSLQGLPFPLVATVQGDWDLHKAQAGAKSVLQQHPDLLAFYCNNDIMALGVSLAVREAGKTGQVMVIGTDGIQPAKDAIQRGEMAATVDSHPFETGMVAVEAALRLHKGQQLPRAIFSPQQLVDNATVDARPDMRGFTGR